MSALRKAVQDYIEMRRSLGFKLHDTAIGLRKFVTFLEQHNASHITVALSLQWAQENSAVQPVEWARRLSFVRGFARHWSATDPRTEVPPEGLLPYRPARVRPYLYSEQEVRRLLQAALELASLQGLASKTYYCLLGLLSVTGLRISEAIHLRYEDVDLTEGILAVRNTKFGKSRFVPIHPSTQRVLCDYAAHRVRFLAGRPACFFFVSRRGTRLEPSRVRRTFYTLSQRTGLRTPGASHGPRLHDFRHGFAIQTLIQWYRSGQDVERRLPILSNLSRPCSRQRHLLVFDKLSRTDGFGCEASGRVLGEAGMKPPATLAVLLEGFFTQRLMNQKQASPHTLRSYRDTFRLLLRFAQQCLHKSPSCLAFEEIDAPLVTSFLEDLEMSRGITARSRNLRLTAIRSFFRYAAYEEPSRSSQIQRVLAMPSKRYTRSLIHFLDRSEIQALLAAPDQKTWYGRRDYTLLLVAVQTGLRLSELTGLQRKDVHLGVGAHVRCIGKGRKERCTPLTKTTAAVLKTWLAEPTTRHTEIVFPTACGACLSPDSVKDLVDKHVALARQTCPSLRNKRVTPHVLRHTMAMQLLQAGVDRAIIALWLGHESVETTQIYLDANLTLKEEILARTISPEGKLVRFKPDDELMTFLNHL